GVQPVSAVMPPTATQDVACAPSQDQLVTFDFSVIRSSEQGFFDIKARVEDIFCAAKADVQPTARAGSAAAVTVGFACGAGAVGEVDTHLYMSDVEIACRNLGNATIKSATITPDGNGYLPANQITD